MYKSTDGANWNVLNTVRATNSSSQQTYFVSDERAVPDQIYYYIEEVDINGKKTTHAVLSNKNCGTTNNGTSIYPNPTNGQEVTVTSDINIVSVELLSVDGKLVSVYSHEQEDKVFRFFPELISGTYFVKIIGENEIQTKTLVITE